MGTQRDRGASHRRLKPHRHPFSESLTLVGTFKKHFTDHCGSLTSLASSLR